MARTASETASAPTALGDALFRLDGRVAVVTGASGGLGESMARALAGAGAQVVITARRMDRLERLAADLDGAVPVACDLSRDEEVEMPVQRAIAECGRVDILVNNAAMENSTPAIDETTESFRRVVDVNLVAPFVLARAAARDMLAREARGTIINIASIIGVVGLGRIPQASYAASKGGLVNLTRELSAQWSRHGIRVNAIGPGFFESEMTEGLLGNELGRSWVARGTPIGRHGVPHEIDGPLLFLASEASSYVTGHTLMVDGGWTTI